ncbi:MAG: hypothetical protein L0H23_04265, partial [Luteimonas sp.]|nr:hypothetical protein [Luteimonas sp.]
MAIDSAPPLPQRAELALRLYPLWVHGSHGQDYGYLVIEVARHDFAAACRYLRETDWLARDLVPLLLSDVPLTAADLRQLPARVPWLAAAADIDAQLRALRTALVLPLEQRALVCVDFADLVAVLANGGEARLLQAVGETAATACEALFAHGACD